MLLQDLIDGSTDKESVMDRFGVSCPPEDIGWVFDIGAGDGLWSAIMADYAKEATVIQYDWRPAAVIRDGVHRGYPSKAAQVYVPFGIAFSVNPFDRSKHCATLESRPVNGLDLSDLLSQHGADPSRTVLRLAGVTARCAVAALDGVPPLLHLIVQAVSAFPDDDAAVLYASVGRLYGFIPHKDEKEILYVTMSQRNHQGSD